MNIFITGGSSGIGQCLKNHFETCHTVSAPERQILNLSIYPSIELGSYDVMILCAGSDLGGKNLFVDMTDQQWQDTMQVNLLSNMKLIKDYVTIRGASWSKIIVIGTTATDHIWPGMLPYTVSKIALEHFCQGIRQEINPNIGVSIVRPGLVKTNFNMARHQGRISKNESDHWYDSQPYLEVSQLVPLVESLLQDQQHVLQQITISL